MKALVLLNLGSPEGGEQGPTEESVRRYLGEFLMDPYVVDIPFPLRWALVHGVILPKRPQASLRAYRKIWTERGSPLRVHLSDLAEKVSEQMPDWIVRPAMRYGTPSLQSVFDELCALRATKPLDELIVFPLYPQYAWATTESSIQHVRRFAKRILPGLPIGIVEPFYSEALFLDAFAEVVREPLLRAEPEFVLFSFHGLPERQIRKVHGRRGVCLTDDHCCGEITELNQDCYRAQCFATAASLARRLHLSEAEYRVSFQSRLGRSAWIRPHTEELYGVLARRGIRKVAVICPSFVADCLETLEEVGIRGARRFKKEGGESLVLLPSLNSSPMWASAVAQLSRSCSTRLR